MITDDEIFTIEEGFWLRDENYFRLHLDAHCLLAFPQAGEMHGVFSMEEVAATATQENRWRDLTMRQRQRLTLTDEALAISYRADATRAEGEPYSALVTSIYVLRTEGWKLAAHQHSPVTNGDQRLNR